MKIRKSCIILSFFIKTSKST